MSKKLVYLGSAVAAVSYYEYTRYMKILDSVSIKPTNTKVKKQGDKLQITFDLDVTNATSKTLELDKVTTCLMNKDLKIADFKTVGRSNIRANSTSRIKVAGMTTPAKLIKLIEQGNILTNDYTLKTKATVRFNVLGVLSLPMRVSDTSTFKANEIFADLNNIIEQFKILFKK